jgi:hypothetical protein
MTNRKCKVLVKEVHILNLEEYNKMILIYFFAQIGIAFIFRT